MKKLSYDYNHDEDTLSIFIDGEFFDEWEIFYGDPETSFKSFENIYKAGFKDGLTLKENKE